MAKGTESEKDLLMARLSATLTASWKEAQRERQWVPLRASWWENELEHWMVSWSRQPLVELSDLMWVSPLD
jgi:hypothetical protein